MKKTLKWLVVACFVAGGADGVTPVPLVAQEGPGPGEVVALLFQHMKAGDADAMQALMHPDVRLISTGMRDGVPTTQVMGVEGWINGVRNATRELDEQIYDTVVHISGPLASVWTKYDLFVDGTHAHCGVDHVLLALTGDGWRIINLADTRSREGCRGS